MRTDRGEYRARQLIIAAGAWLPEFLDADLARHFTRHAPGPVLVRGGRRPLENYAAPRFPVWIWELQDREHVIYGFPAIDGATAFNLPAACDL